MIKIPIEKVTIQARELPAYADPVFREAGEVLIDPHEALKALEEQDHSALDTYIVHKVLDEMSEDQVSEMMTEFIKVAPKQALNILEEQAPEVLRERAYGPTMKFGMDGTERLCRALYGRKDVPADYMGGAGAKMLHDAADRLTTSPWIKVSDQEPPKDGSEFFYREKSNNDKWMHYALSWLEDCEMWVTGFGYENVSEDIAPDGEWMPMPE